MASPSTAVPTTTLRRFPTRISPKFAPALKSIFNQVKENELGGWMFRRRRRPRIMNVRDQDQRCRSGTRSPGAGKNWDVFVLLWSVC